MQYLLDTQILVWSLEGNPKLNSSLREIIENPANTIFVSQISIMELSIKLKIGKLPEFIVSIEHATDQLIEDGFNLLPITNNHIFSYQAIPFFADHRDPFDRFLLATALSEQIPIISIDEKFSLYQSLVTIIN